ncbi:hypothetical protein GALMADRAFT_95991 [Galerina marginata CBS 339.88]|uniref:Conidiation protein 6 n=1 Tax=Galerina marginata (strain CBS 339.88) TaxID=685588 RepID=A0A067TE34_GALM3|nr:hypothetical protein GALMADRAFT_95991 [Galerina marginata CBS 339.88]
MSGIRLSSTILPKRLLMPRAGYHCFRIYSSDAPAHGKNPERVAAGLKATLHNPATSPEAKDSARHRLHEMGEKDPERVAAGLKASLHNPATSSEAKKHASSRLVELGYEIDESGKVSAAEEEHRKLGGYKATLKNVHASEAAKEHATKVLKEHGAI